MRVRDDVRTPTPAPGRRHRIDPVWRHAPVVLLHYPALFAAIAFGAILLALAAAAYPLFLSATTSSLVRSSIERESITRYGAGITYRFRSLPLGDRAFDPDEIGQAFDRIAARSPILGEPIRNVLGDGLSVSTPGSDDERDARLFSGTDALAHVQVLRGHDGAGVWLPDLVADALGIDPGDTVTLTAQSGRSIDVSVDGVYRAVYTIYGAPSDGYWNAWQDEFAVPCPDCAPPAQPILAGPAQALDLMERLHQDSATMLWDAPIADPANVSLQDVRALDTYESSVVDAMSDFDSSLGRIFGPGSDVTSSASYVIRDVAERIASVEGPAHVLEVAGIAVALAVVAAAGAFSLRARRTEAAWSFARGSSAAAIAVKTALESVLPLGVGAAIGGALAGTAVAALGPDGPIAGAAVADAGIATAVSVAGATLLVATVAGITYVRVVDPHGRRAARLARLVPWELGLAALTLLALRRLERGGAFVHDPASGAVSPSLSLVAFPFLMFGTAAVVAARLSRPVFGRLRAATARARGAPYLAARRLAGGGALTMLLVGAAVLCLATFLHAEIVAGSLRTTVRAKAGVFVGSDVQGRIDYTTPLPASFSMPTTRVVRIGSGFRLPTGRPLDLLAIDASTFASAAFWNDAFSDVPLDRLVAALREPSGDRIPVVLAAGGDLELDRLEIAGTEVPVEVVGRASAFPGMTSLNPLVVVDARTFLDRIDLPFDPLRTPSGSTELWVRGPPGRALRSLAGLEFPPTSTVTAEEVQDISYIAAAVDTFVVVNALGLIAACLVFVGMLMYLQARQRSQVVSYALSARMGMRDREHRTALALELGAMVVWGFAVGLMLALGAARITVPRLDPITTIPPDPILVTPIATFGVAAALAGALAWLGAVLTERRARHVDLAEVMRVAE